MDSERGTLRMNLERDKLSILPVDLIHKILSSTSIKHVIELSALSSRWRFIWTSMPYLNFSSEDFQTLSKFSNFVTHVLSHLSDHIQLCSVKLRFRGMGREGFVKQIMDYAFSHNVQQLIVTSLLERSIEFPLSLFSSQSLKQLTLTGPSYFHLIRLESTLELPSLSTLHLSHVLLFGYNTDNDIGLFSKCVNLKKLVLHECLVDDFGGSFNICHPRLSDLTFVGLYCRNISVAAPQLKKLTFIRNMTCYRVSAPELVSFTFKGYNSPFVFEDGLRSLEEAHLCIYTPSVSAASSILDQLRQLHTVKFLTLNMEIIQVLSSSVELISHQPSPFDNLKSLKIYPNNAISLDRSYKKVTMSTKFINYLLNSSPSTTFTIISHKDYRARYEAIPTHNLMSKLQELLELEKSNIKTNRAPMEQGKSTTESYMANYWQDIWCSTLITVSLEVILDRTQQGSCEELVTKM